MTDGTVEVMVMVEARSAQQSNHSINYSRRVRHGLGSPRGPIFRRRGSPFRKTLSKAASASALSDPDDDDDTTWPTLTTHGIPGEYPVGHVEHAADDSSVVAVVSPWVILSDFGSAFAMGAVGGTIWHGIKGARNSPRVSCS